MSLSGSAIKTFASGGALSLIIEWSATQNVSANTSTVTARAYLKGNYSYSTLYAPAVNSGSIRIDGTSYGFRMASSITGTQKKLLATASKTISHADNGTKSFSFSVTFNVNVTFSGQYIGNQTASGSASLNTIPRASTFITDKTTYEMGTPVTMKITAAASGFSHKVWINFGSKRVLALNAPATGVNVNFTPSLADFASQIPNATTGNGSFELETYNGSTKIGTYKQTRYLTIPSSVVPTATAFTLSEKNVPVASILGDGINFAQSMSIIGLSVTASGAYGSTIKERQLEIGTKNFTGDNFNLNGSGLAPGDYDAYVRVKDSRGRWSSYLSQKVAILEYHAPRITLKAERVDSTGKPEDEGSIVKLSITGSVSPLSNKNARNIEIKYQNASATDWIPITHAITSYEINNVVYVNNISPDSAYTFQISVRDSFGGTAYSVSVSTAFTTVDYRSGGKGIAFGQVATRDGFVVGARMPMSIAKTANGDFINFIDDKDNLLGKIGQEQLDKWAELQSIWGKIFDMAYDYESTYRSGKPTFMNNWADNGYFTVERYGKIVYLNIDMKLVSSYPAGQFDAFRLPDWAKPRRIQRGILFSNSSPHLNKDISIRPDGVGQFDRVGTSAGEYAYGSMSYIAADAKFS